MPCSKSDQNQGISSSLIRSIDNLSDL